MVSETSILIERIARAQWEARREHLGFGDPDIPDLEDWGDGAIPTMNGIYKEAAAAYNIMTHIIDRAVKEAEARGRIEGIDESIGVVQRLHRDRLLSWDDMELVRSSLVIIGLDPKRLV